MSTQHCILVVFISYSNHLVVFYMLHRLCAHTLSGSNCIILHQLFDLYAAHTSHVMNMKTVVDLARVCKDCIAVRPEVVFCALRYCGIAVHHLEPNRSISLSTSILSISSFHVQRQACLPPRLPVCRRFYMLAYMGARNLSTFGQSTDRVRTLPSRKLQCQCLQALKALNPAISWCWKQLLC